MSDVDAPSPSIPSIDPAAYHLPATCPEVPGGPEDHLPPVLPPPVEDLKLLKPENVKSRYWIHFSKYDTEFHPDKKTTARCNLCGKEISVKQGTGGLKNHLKFKHPEESSALVDPNELQDNFHTPGGMIKTEGGLPPSSSSRLGGVSSAGGGANNSNTPAKKKPKREHTNLYSDLTIRMDTEKRCKDKHLMEMWSMTRREIRELRQELKDEEDENVIRELEGDVRVLRKRKADYADMLGFKDDFAPENIDV